MSEPTVTMSVAGVNELIEFIGEVVGPATKRTVGRMVQGAIIPAPAPEVPAKASAEAEEGATNG
jgi:hypothetical protein